MFKPLHPAGAHSYSFSAPSSSLQYWALDLEPSSRCGLCSWRLPCLCVGTYLIQTVPKPVSVWISSWGSLRNCWAAVTTTTLLIPGTQEGKAWKKPKGFLRALSHMAIHGVATQTTPWLFGFLLPFSVMLSPCAIFASLLSCHATVRSLLIPTKELHSPVISSGNGTNLSKFLSLLPTPFPFCILHICLLD